MLSTLKLVTGIIGAILLLSFILSDLPDTWFAVPAVILSVWFGIFLVDLIYPAEKR